MSKYITTNYPFTAGITPGKAYKVMKEFKNESGSHTVFFTNEEGRVFETPITNSPLIAGHSWTIHSGIIAWKVFANNQQVDTVYFTDDCDAEYVKQSLICHDNYRSDIVVSQ